MRKRYNLTKVLEVARANKRLELADKSNIELDALWAKHGVVLASWALLPRDRKIEMLATAMVGG